MLIMPNNRCLSIEIADLVIEEMQDIKAFADFWDGLDIDTQQELSDVMSRNFLIAINEEI